MKQKINIAELLKDCPKGMELDCTMFDNVYFDEICDYEDCLYQIRCYIIADGVRNSINFTKYGEFNTMGTAKCVIFPKGKTTWEGFHKPFKDGDIVATEHGLFIGIVKVKNNIQLNAYCAIDEHGSFAKNINYGFERFATEEEKEKLFQAIKANGYRWNSKTKILEELFPYKIGTKVWVKSDKEHKYIHTIVGISRNSFSNLEYEVKEEKTGTVVHYPKDLLIPVAEEKPKFKDGDVLFVDCSDDEENKLYQFIFILKKTGFYGKWHAYCYLDEVGNLSLKETYLTDDKYHPRFATKEEKEKLFKAIKDNGYKWNEETKTLEKLPKFKVGDEIKYKYPTTDTSTLTIIKVEYDKNRYVVCDKPNNFAFLSFFAQDNFNLIRKTKFDTSTLVPFDSRVLVRDNDYDVWRVAFWGYLREKQDIKYDTTRGVYKQCIPYEGNEHLLGKTDDCEDYYKTWL